MDVEKLLKNHYRRWNVNFELEDEFLKFKNRLVSLLNELAGDYLAENLDIDNEFFKITRLEKADPPDVRKSSAYPKISQNVFKHALGHLD